MTTHVLTVSPAGRVEFVYADDLAALLHLGMPAVARASHVEFRLIGESDTAGVGGWYAELSPVGGPVLGPYSRRRKAVADEVAWLEANVIGGR